MSSTEFEIIGITRFSYPSPTGFIKSFETTKEITEFLYDPARLELRMDVFEQFCLPSLQKQTNKNFRHVLLIADDFPDWALERLKKITSAVPQIVIHALPAMPHIEAISTLLLQMFAPSAKFHISYWLDDDDALHLQYIQNLIDRFEETKHLVDKYGQLGYAQGKGILCNISPGNMFAKLAILPRPQSAGLVVFSKSELKVHVYMVHHQFIQTKMLVITDQSEYSYIATQHGLNDFRQVEHTQKAQKLIPVEVFLDTAQEKFGLDLTPLFDSEF